MTAEEALRRLLANSGLTAHRSGPRSYRIERAAAAPPISPKRHEQTHAARQSPPPPAIAEEIVVTGQKRRQDINRIPMSLSVVDMDDKAFANVSANTELIGRSVDGLALTNLGPGRNRQFIRGVADGPFDGPSQSTVAVQLDDTRLTFDAPDPDIRLVDMDRVEVLKGPQGPLYGSGALGGIYHMVTHKPDATAISGHIRVAGEAMQYGGLGGGGEAVINLPIVDDRLALRAVGYADHRAGWIDNLGRNRNSNSADTAGGRLALRWQPDPDWTIDISGVLQNVNVADSQYVTNSTATVRRDARIPEPTDNDFKSVAATIQRRLGAINLSATTSYVAQNVAYKLDSTDASNLFGLSGPSQFSEDNRYSLWNNELRISSANSGRWVAGISYMETVSRGAASMANGANTVAVDTTDRRIAEMAVFGELELPLSDSISLTGGARLFRTVQENEAAEAIAHATSRISKVGFSPSAAIAWHPDARSLVYLRYARALRPGGLTPEGDNATRRFDSDELGTFDLGYRRTNDGNTFALSASLFLTTWDHIQSDYLLPNGLVSTRNAGQGRIRGLELSGEWQPVDRLKLTAGLTYLDAKLIKTEGGLKLKDRRLPVAPRLSGRFSMQYSLPLGAWDVRLSAQANYFGHARLTFDEYLDRTMGNYAILTGGAVVSRGRLTVGMRLDNALNIRGDSFAFGNPFSIMDAQQFTPIQPRTLTFSVARSW